MAPNQYVQTATQQVSPLFAGQSAALQAQMPAIQQLFSALGGQLKASGQSQRQNIYEATSGRGVLRSTIPIDMETALNQNMLAEEGQLASDQIQQTGNVQNQLAGLGVNQANAIAQLVQSLFGMDQQTQQASQSQQLADREYQLQLERLRRGIF